MYVSVAQEAWIGMLRQRLTALEAFGTMVPFSSSSIDICICQFGCIRVPLLGDPQLLRCCPELSDPAAVGKKPGAFQSWRAPAFHPESLGPHLSTGSVWKI